MGAIGDALVAYAQPLLDEAGETAEEKERALSVAMLCYNLALLPEDEREKALVKMKSSLTMTEEEFADFRQGVILPMIQRHRAMFSGMHERLAEASRIAGAGSTAPQKQSGTGRNDPCPCGSGRKYKRCCGARR